MNPLIPPPTLGSVVLVLGLSSILLREFSIRRGHPGASVLARWMRWAFVALGTAFLLQASGLSSRPLWMLALSGFLGWFLLETLFNWMAIDVWSRTSSTPFPIFKENTKGDEWPNLPRTIRLRDWLRKEGFRKVKNLIAEIAPGTYLRTVVFENQDATIRLQVLFIPQNRDLFLEAFVLSSQSADGGHLITDNLFVPFGGFYPENWEMERKTWTRSPASLLNRHRERIEAWEQPLVPFHNDPEEDLQNQQHSLDRLNTDLGLLWPRNERADHGSLTRDGRYRVWKEIWFLNYFGKSS
jgi:hypothetical protein